VSLPLQHQHTRPLRIIWIILDHHRILDTGQDLPDQASVGRSFLIAVRGDLDAPIGDQRPNPRKGLAHTLRIRFGG